MYQRMFEITLHMWSMNLAISSLKH